VDWTSARNSRLFNLPAHPPSPTTANIPDVVRWLVELTSSYDWVDGATGGGVSAKDATILVICKTGRFPRVQFFDFNTDPPYELHISDGVSSARDSFIRIRAYVHCVARI
jgi:hypothetical protein